MSANLALAGDVLLSVASIGAAKGALLIGGLRVGSGQSDVVGLLGARHRKRRRL